MVSLGVLFVPNINAYKNNMYCYKKINGEVLSDVINPAIFELFLEKCKVFWLKKDLTLEEKNNFENNFLNFYKKKTLERVELFYKNFAKKDNATIINGELMPSLQDLLNQIDWKWISSGLSGRFHGDFHFENILYSKSNKKFTFLDWRQDFAGNLSIGDIYYDLAKLMHGLIVNHGIVFKNQYSASWIEGEIKFDIQRKQSLVKCEQRLNAWMLENGYNLKKVKVLTALIYLNIAALHHYPYSLLLYGLGKKILKEDINATQIGLSNAIAIIGSGLVAALSVTFMDTFWFSAVEAEVYAGSSCFTALAFWAILRWERVKDEPTSDRWLVFIAYVIGLGIGLHLLNILVVPAVIFYYFVNKYGSTTSNVLKAAVVGLGSIALLQWIIIPKTPAVGAFFDKIFVNSFGLPYNSGMLFFLLLIGIGIYFIYSYRNSKLN